jgi:GNAT superfamily N-acetyltransferase
MPGVADGIGAGYRDHMGAAIERSDITVVPASADRFDDVETMLAPRTPTVVACWCLVYRLDARTNRELTADQRREHLRTLCGGPLAPGVLAYAGPEVVGWAGIGPRADIRGIRDNRKIPPVDDLPVWSLWCLKVRPGHRGRGVSLALIDGAVRHAFENGAPAVESYPMDSPDHRVDPTAAFVGTRSMFEAAGFTVITDTAATSARVPRVLMRRHRSGAL